MTQADRIHAALQAGPVQSTDFLNPADGGPPILRVAARIYDLRQQGHTIRETRNANGTSTYILTAGAPSPPSEGLPETVPSSAQPPWPVTDAAAAMAPPPHSPSGAGEPTLLFDVAEFERPGFMDAA